MSQKSWRLEVFQVSAYGSAVGRNSGPSEGNEEGTAAVSGVHIKRGNYEGVRLDNLSAAAIAMWPGAIKRGRGEASYYVDVRAKGKQREALCEIVRGRIVGPFAKYRRTVVTAARPKSAVISMIINGPRSGLKIERLAEVQLVPRTRRGPGRRGRAPDQAVGEASVKTLRVDNGRFKFDCTGGYATHGEEVWEGARRQVKSDAGRDGRRVGPIWTARSLKKTVGAARLWTSRS